MSLSKYTSARAKRICDLIRKGVTIEGAVESAGISHETHYAWRRKYPEYLEAVTRANGDSEVALVDIATKGATKDPRIAVAILERRFGGRWGKAEHHQVTANHTLNTVTPQVIEGLASLPESPRAAQIQHTNEPNPTKTVTVNV